MSLFGGGHSPAAQTPTRAMGIDLQGAQYGAPIPVVFGRNKLAANVIDYMDFQAIAHTQKQQGGKGGGGGQTSTSYTYSVSYLLGLAEGVGSIVSVYDGSSSTTLSAVGGLSFSGAAGQAPWAHLSGSHALGYSGTLLVAFQNKNLGSSASLPNYNFEVDGRNAYGGGIVDANPADIVTAICTDTQIGVQFNALGDLTAFRDYCTAAGIFFSPVYATQNPAMQVLDDLFKYSNCAAFFSEGVLKVVPYGDETITGNGVTYTPNLTAVADLTRDDFITNGPSDPVTVKRIAPADAMNIQRVEFKDRANTYHTGTVVASIDQDVVGTGARADQSDSVDMITSADVARIVVQNLLQRGFYIRNTYEFQLPWRYCYLEPMDIVTLTDGNTGLYLDAVRIIEIGEDEHGLLSGVAEEFPEGISHASTYATQPNAGTGVNPNADPGPITSPYLFRGPGFLVSNNQPEIWCALSGVDPLWAGCDVYLSHDGTSYTYLTTHSRRAAYGETTNSLAAGSDPDTTGAPNVVLNGPVELLGGTAADADQFVTLSMIDNELIAYQTATLAGGPSYTLGYLRRGGYGSTVAAHAAAAPFVRLDENILRIPVDPSQIGQTVYLKFVSFNVFGKGGRTLADETAYTYVIGTNIELPDVPVTPASVAVNGVADGNSITWYNSNPAAVGCTSIEYATAAGGPWTVLAQVGPTTTAYAHHFTNGATYFYRLRSRGPVVAGGWSAYTSVYSATGTNVGAISATANSAANGPAVINPQFSNGLTGWTPSNPTGWYVQTGGANLPDPIVNTAVVHAAGGGAATTDALYNAGHIPVVPGQQVTVTCCVNEVGANAGALGYARISWRNASNAEIGTSAPSGSAQYPTCGAAGTGTYTQCVTKVIAAAPAGAQFAVAEPTITGHTAGYFLFSNVCMVAQPSSVDELPDGSAYARPRASQLNNGVISLLGSGRNAIKNGTFSANTLGTAVNANVNSGQNYDGWTVTGTGTFATTIHYAGYVACRILSGFAIAGSGYTNGPSITSDRYAVVAGSSFAFRVARTVFVSAGTFAPAGVTFYQRMAIQWFAADGTTVTTTTYDTPFASSAAFATTTFTGTVPTGATTAVVYQQLYVGNTSSATTLPGSGAYVEVGFQAVEYVQAAVMDTEVADGTNYGRTAQADLYISGGLNRVGLRIAGSGHTLGNQLNAPNSLTLNYGGVRSATALTASSSGAVSVNDHTIYMGGTSVHYNAVANAVTGLTVGGTYQIYCHDPGGTGGTKTWYAATSIAAALQQGDDVVIGGQVTIPSSGTSGGGGTTGCPDENAWVLRADPAGLRDDWCVRAKEVEVGHYLRLTDGRIGLVTYSKRKASDRVRVFAEGSGKSLTCSATAPLELAECRDGAYTGECVLAPEAAGRVVRILCDRPCVAAQIDRVDDAGSGYVQHITCQNACFWTGDDPDYLFGHHNMKPG